MPVVKSYLAYSVAGRRADLEEALLGISGCEVTPSTNRDLVVLVTEAEDEAAEQALADRLRTLPSLLWLVMVSGYEDWDQDNGGRLNGSC